MTIGRHPGRPLATGVSAFTHHVCVSHQNKGGIRC